MIVKELSTTIQQHSSAVVIDEFIGDEWCVARYASMGTGA
jgi:hypothetical protein